MPTSRDLEKQIERVERFRVQILSENGRRIRSDANGFDDYPYQKAASSDLTVAAWIEARFIKHYDDYGVKVFDENGRAVHGRTELATIRTVPKVKSARITSPVLSQTNLPLDPPEPPHEVVEDIPGQITFDDFVKTSIRNTLLEILKRREQPSASELVNQITQACGLHARWLIVEVVAAMLESENLPWAVGPYLKAVFLSDDLEKAVEGDYEEVEGIRSSIDSLIHNSRAYRQSREFKEMIEFMARFRNYSPFNNMLVKVQNPSCGYFATEKDWNKKHRRRLKEDARPMLILAPMHPVMLVFDLDQTEGRPLPSALENFASFFGKADYECLERAVQNAAAHYKIRVDFKQLSSTLAGFATTVRGDANFLMRTAIHGELNTESRIGVLCHELAHILLGHLGSGDHNWWPSRQNLGKNTFEIEAEAVAHIVTTRMGLYGSSAEYISGYLKEGDIPAAVSLDTIAKVAGRIEDIFKTRLSAREVPEKKKN